MTFLQVKQDHRSIPHGKRGWYEFVSGEFLTPQQAANCNVDLRKCRIVDVKNVNKMYWCFGALLCDKEDFTVVAEKATAFDGQILRYHYDIYIGPENDCGEFIDILYKMSLDSDTTLTSKTWKILRKKVREISVSRNTTAWVSIARKERDEIMASAYMALYCADYSGSYRHEHYFNYATMDGHCHNYPITIDRAKEGII